MPPAPQNLAAQPGQSPASVVEDATCLGCGCLCDDIRLSTAGDRITSAEHACELGRQWLTRARPTAGPNALIDGQPADLETALGRAAEILATAKAPLVYGLTQVSADAQRVAVAIADWLGASLDTPTSQECGPSGVSFQGVGDVTCSLGEVANRADLVIFWGCDPATTHPRHFSRYSLEPRGMFVPGGRADRTCVVVDTHASASASVADILLEIQPDRHFEALWTLRAILQDIPLSSEEVLEQTGVALDRWRDLIDRMNSSNFGVIVHGRGLSGAAGGRLSVEAVLALVRDLNAVTHFVAQSLRGAGNRLGADNVVCWQTGYPFAVDLARGYPRYNPDEYSAETLLARGEVDAALWIGVDPADELGAAALRHLESIPRVVLQDVENESTRSAEVVLLTATSGIHTGGAVYRMDDVPLPLRPPLTSQRMSDVEMLRRLEERVRGKNSP